MPVKPTAFSFRLRLHCKAALAGGVMSHKENLPREVTVLKTQIIITCLYIKYVGFLRLLRFQKNKILNWENE